MWGVVMEVPAKFAKPLSGIDESIHWPGARSERNEALLENEETSSAVVPREPSSVEPTLTALEIHPGEESALVKPSFPAAITVAMSADLRLSMIGFSGSTSQFESNRPPPTLVLTPP